VSNPALIYTTERLATLKWRVLGPSTKKGRGFGTATLRGGPQRPQQAAPPSKRGGSRAPPPRRGASPAPHPRKRIWATTVIQSTHYYDEKGLFQMRWYKSSC